MSLLSLQVSGLNEAISTLEGLASGGVARAVERALGGGLGGENTGRKWEIICRAAAEKVLKAHVRPSRQGMIPGFVRAVTHAFFGNPSRMEISMEGQHFLMLARMMSERKHVSEYVRKGVVTRRLRRNPDGYTPEETAEIERVEEVVRAWVEAEKRLDERDAEVDFDPDQITDRVMRVIGVTDREGWKYLLRSEAEGAGLKVLRAISDWLGQVAAQPMGLPPEPSESSKEAWLNLMHEGFITPDTPAWVRDRWADGWRTEFSGEFPGVARAAREAPSLDEIAEWLDMVLAAWESVVAQEIGWVVLRELDRELQPQKELALK